MKTWRLALLGLVLAIAGGLANSCIGMDDVPLEHADIGTYRVVDGRMPQTDHRATAFVERLRGKAFILGPDRILFPAEFGHADCQHQGYRLTQSSVLYLPPFDLGPAGLHSALELGLEEKQMIEVWCSCFYGSYLSEDREHLYIPAAGALLVLEKI